jgi:hypothetical protein
MLSEGRDSWRVMCLMAETLGCGKRVFGDYFFIKANAYFVVELYIYF